MLCISNALFPKYMNVISGQILQFVSQPAFLTILTQNRLCGKKIRHIYWATDRWQLIGCVPKSHIFYFKISTDARAIGSKFSAQCYDKVVCPSYMHTAWNSMYFVRAAAIPSQSKKLKYVIWNAPQMFSGGCLRGENRSACILLVAKFL